MREGMLIWDGSMQRPDIMYQGGTFYGGLHCGNTLEALIRDEWVQTRIECRGDGDDDIWYLVDIGDQILWLAVRN